MAFSNGWLGKRAIAPLLLGSVLGMGGCDGGPPQQFFVKGKIKQSGEPVAQIKDVYVWRQPSGSATMVLLSDRALPALPAQDAFPIVDLGLMLYWSRAPLGELTLDAQGKLLSYAMRGSTGGGESGDCTPAGNGCHSAVDYWNPAADWGDETMSARRFCRVTTRVSTHKASQPNRRQMTTRACLHATSACEKRWTKIQRKRFLTQTGMTRPLLLRC